MKGRISPLHHTQSNNNNLISSLQPRYNGYFSLRVSSVVFAIFLALNSLKIGLLSIEFISSAHPHRTILFHSILSFAYCLPAFLLCFRRTPYLIFIYAVQALYFAANLIYFRYFHCILHLSVALELSREAAGVCDSITPLLLLPRNWLILMDLPVLVWLLVHKSKNTVESPFAPLKFKTQFGLSIICSLAIFASLDQASRLKGEGLFTALSSKPNKLSFGTYLGEATIVQRYGLLVNEIVHIMKGNNEQELTQQLAIPTHSIHFEASPSHDATPNILILQVESLDAQMVGFKVNGKLVMPYLTGLVDSSLYFPYSVSYHGSGGSSDAEMATINSMQPLLGHASFKLSGYKYPNSLVQVLKSCGYQAYAFHGNNADYFNRNFAYHLMGFHQFIGPETHHLRAPSFGASDADLLNYMVQYLKQTDSPWLAYLITITSHAPFRFYKDFTQSKHFPQLEQGKSSTDYLESMAYVDSALGASLPELQKANPDMLIVIFGDHTPGIQDSILASSYLPNIPDQYPELVPLIIWGKGLHSTSAKRFLTSSLDVAPTILGYTNFQGEYHSQGCNLLSADSDCPSIPYRGTLLPRKAY